MAFCSNCGNQIDEGSQFCNACGAAAGASAQPTMQLGQVQPAQAQPTQAIAPQASLSKYRIAVLLIPLVLIFLFSCCCFSSFVILSIAGAKGQPSTVVPPSPASESTTATSGSSVSIPKNLNADSTSEEINLNWGAVSNPSLKSYKVYKSYKPGENFVPIATVDASKTVMSDPDAKKGVVYYYVVTAVTVDGAESGNSNQTSAIVESPPLVEQGINSWAGVQKRCKKDAKYLSLLTKVTGLTMSDVDRLAQKEKSGMYLKKTLAKGTVITNSTKNYKILPNFALKTDRIALTDENGVPHVLCKCGNPMKIQVYVSTPAVIIQQTQIFITNVVMIMPPTIINIFINTAQAVNGMTVLVLPNGIKIILGPTFAPPPPGVYIDPADFGEDAEYTDEELEIRPQDTHEEGEEEISPPEETTPPEEEQVPPEEETPPEEVTPPEEELPEGQQWIEKGQLLVTANPPDPAPSQSVTMTVRLTSGESGVEMSYEVSGTDGYSDSGTQATDANGEISFNIPGGATGVQDTISVSVPSKGLQGSASYQF